MSKLVPVFLVFSLAAGSAGATASKVLNYPQYAIAVHGEVEILLWVSEDILNSSDPPEEFPGNWWPAVERSRTALQRMLNKQSECESVPQEDSRRLQTWEEKKASSAMEQYEDFLASSPAVVVGNVQRVEPGAVLVGDVEVKPRVTVTVLEVLRDLEGSLFPGEELTYIVKGGLLRLGTRSLCSLGVPELAVPQEGERVVLTASTPDGQEGLASPSTVFSLLEDTVTVPPGTRFEKGQIPLQELRLAAAGVEEGGGR